MASGVLQSLAILRGRVSHPGCRSDSFYQKEGIFVETSQKLRKNRTKMHLANWLSSTKYHCWNIAMKCKSDHKTSQISKLIESGEASAKINQTLKHITEIWGKLCPHLLSSDPRAKGNLCHWPNGRSNQSCISKHPLPASLSSALQKA